jgi:tetratricopeptide (TPR) repeat protein
VQTDVARFTGTEAAARLAVAYSDSALHFVTALTGNPSGHGSLLFEQARALDALGVATADPSRLSRAQEMLDQATVYRDATRPTVYAETCEERARIALAQARLTPRTAAREAHLRQAGEVVRDAQRVLRAAAASPRAIARLDALDGEIQLELGVTLRSRAALDSAQAAFVRAEPVLLPSDLPRPAALLLLQRARLAAALGDTVTARGRLEHAIEIAGAPRLDSLVIQQGSALRTSLRR